MTAPAAPTLVCTTCGTPQDPPRNPAALVVVCSNCAHGMIYERSAGRVRDLTRAEAKEIEGSPAFVVLRNRQIAILEKKGWLYQ